MNGLLSLGLLLLAGTVRAGVGADFATPATIGGELAYNKDFMSGILQAFMSPKGINATRLLEAFSPTPCLQKCMPSLNQFLNSFNAKQSLRDAENTAKLCRQLESIDECAATSNCDSSLLDLATKTYKFACIDKIESLGDSLKCAQDAFAGARADCEAGCIVDRSTSLDALVVVDPAKLPVDVASLCESSVCLLGCMQRSINAACVARGNTPSLLGAILTTSTKSGDDSTLSSFLSGMLPENCRDVLKAQANLPERIAQLAAIGKDAIPHSVGKPKAAPQPAASTAAPTTTTTTTVPLLRPTTTVTSTMTTSQAAGNPLAWAPAPIEAPLDVDGEARTLQCRVLDWERRPVASPSIDRLARLIAQQYLAHQSIQMRADDGDADVPEGSEAADSAAPFRRWLAAHDADSYRAIGFGAPTAREGNGGAMLRAATTRNAVNSAAADQPSSYPSWTNLALAGLFPFVIYLMD